MLPSKAEKGKNSLLARVLFHNPVAFIGGGEVGLLNIVKALDGLCESIVVLPFRGPLESELQSLPCKTIVQPMPEELSRISRRKAPGLHSLACLPSFASYLRDLNGLVADLSPDLIYSNGLKSHFLCGLVAKWRKIPMLCHVRDVLEDLPFASFFLRHFASLTIGNSEQTCAALDLPEQSLWMIRNALDLESLQREMNSEPPALVGDIRRKRDGLVLSAGKLCQLKGFDSLLDGFSLILEKGWNYDLLIAGSEYRDPEYRDSEMGYRRVLEDKVLELGLGGRVHFLGEVRPLAPLMRECELFVLASRSEGFGRVLAEAMACGLPVIDSRLQPLSYLVGEDEERGLLFDSDDCRDLADTMERALEDPRLMELRAKRAKAFVEANLTLEKLRQSLTAAVERAISREV